MTYSQGMYTCPWTLHQLNNNAFGHLPVMISEEHLDNCGPLSTGDALSPVLIRDTAPLPLLSSMVLNLVINWKYESTKVQTLGALCMRGTAN